MFISQALPRRPARRPQMWPPLGYRSPKPNAVLRFLLLASPPGARAGGVGVNLTPPGLLQLSQPTQPAPCPAIELHDPAVVYHAYPTIYYHYSFFCFARCFPPRSHYLCCDGISGGTAVRRLCSFVCCSGSGCVRAGGCLTGTAPAPAWELLQPCALPALLRSSRAASVSRQCPAGPAWPHGSADGGSSRIA